MSEDVWIKNIKEKHPVLLSNIRYYDLDEGWNQIVEELCDCISSYIEEKNLKMPIVFQIKEKFGALRFYVDWQDDFIKDAIKKAESLSARTCFVCGEPGSLDTNNGWAITLCEKHKN